MAEVTVHGFFDDGFPPGERIPRCLEVTLRAEAGPFGDAVRMTVNGLGVGDPLTDKRVVGDGLPVA